MRYRTIYVQCASGRDQILTSPTGMTSTTEAGITDIEDHEGDGRYIRINLDHVEIIRYEDPIVE